MNVIKRARGVRHFRLNVKEDLDSSPEKSMQQAAFFFLTNTLKKYENIVMKLKAFYN